LKYFPFRVKIVRREMNRLVSVFFRGSRSKKVEKSGRFFEYSSQCLNKLLLVFFCLNCLSTGVAGEKLIINIVYLTQEKSPPAALSNLDPFIPDKGEQGAILATKDNSTTGQFTGQEYVLKQTVVPEGDDISQVFNKLVAEGNQFIVVNLPAEQLRQLVSTGKDNMPLLFDVATRDDSLRQQLCSSNVLHILPSRAMRADALAQYMLKKRWQKWFLVVGATKEDRLFADAIKRSAKRFGSKIIAEKNWDHTHDARRTAQSEVPIFTQGIDYDVLVVADEQGLFGEYLSYRTWKPRPVIGTQGLLPTSWHRTHEQWGAVQIQNRFKEQAGRWMTEQDYGAYLAIRAIGEAATRTHSAEMKVIKKYLLSDQLDLQGYKGRPLSFRPWNGQLRQPVLLVAARSLVAVAPLEGFLHPKTELDTLGFDQPEIQCQ
jgi:ABC transporter substrate binding protein (PQQ-dependent alcohol dehydrogenase system)